VVLLSISFSLALFAPDYRAFDEFSAKALFLKYTWAVWIRQGWQAGDRHIFHSTTYHLLTGLSDLPFLESWEEEGLCNIHIRPHYYKQ
jgi:hypothetical protein